MATIKSWMNSGNWFDSSNYIPTIPQPPLSSKARASYDTWGKEQFRTLWEGRAAEQEKLLKEIEDEIRRIEGIISSGAGGLVEEIKLKELVLDRDKILNPMKYRSRVVGATKVTTLAEKQTKKVESELKKQQKISDLESKIKAEQERLGPLAAGKEVREYERLTGIKVTDPKVIKTLQDFRKKEADIANAEARGKQREAKSKTIEEINKMIEAEEDPMVKAEYKGLLPQINAGTLTPTAAMGLADAIAEKSARELVAKQSYQTGERLARQEYQTGEREARQEFTKQEREARSKEVEDLQVEAANFQNESRRWSMAESSRQQNIKRLQQLIDKYDFYIVKFESLTDSADPEDKAASASTLPILRKKKAELEAQLNAIPGASKAPARQPTYSGMKEESFDATGEPEGKRAKSQDGTIYVVRNGRWVRE